MQAQTSQLQMRVVLLLSAAVFLNYFDRGALSIAAPLVQEELALTPSQMGILFSTGGNDEVSLGTRFFGTLAIDLFRK